MKYQEEEIIIIPSYMLDLQDFTADLWDKIFNHNQTDKIDLYNKAAQKYNDQAGSQLITLITKKQKMTPTETVIAPAKKATKKKTVKKPQSKAAKQKALAKKPELPVVKPKVPAKPKAPAKAVPGISQKSQIVELAEKGKTIDEIVTVTGIKKANVQWYFSKLKLSK